MTTADSRWSDLKRLLAAALDLPPEDRRPFLEANCAEPGRRSEALLLLQACEDASGNPVLAGSAAQFAAPILVEVDERDDSVPEALHADLAGRYTILRELGRGGMATVYLARDERHGRSVALKLLRPTSASPDGSPSRGAALFEKEIEFAASLSHPHILPLYDSGAAGGLLYYITPYVDGETLRDRLARTGRPPLAQCLSILRDVARALVYAHRHDLVHRDIKPANILLTRDGDALVADFGVARGLAAARATSVPRNEETVADLVVGTPAYMAPEQASAAANVDHRADLYAFGIVAYELLTGTTPFAGRSRQEQLAAHFAEMPEPLASRATEAPAALAVLVHRLLAKQPADRPRDAAEVLRVLDAVIVENLPLLGPGEPTGTSERSIAVPSVGAGRGTDDREAYELYLKGRYLTNMRQREGLDRALAYFERAIDRDPGYAKAWAGIADVWTFLGIFGHAPPHDAFRRGREAAERATSLDETLVEAQASLAHVLYVYDWQWEAAEAAFQRLISTGPPYPRLRMFYAAFLHSVGRSTEALEQLAVARELDPLAPIGLLSGRVFVDTQRPAAAIDVLSQEIQLDPGLDLAHQLLAHAYLQEGRGEEAVSSMRRAAELSGLRDLAQLAYVHARVGNEAESRRVLSDVLSRGEQEFQLLGFHIAMACAGLGDIEQAFTWLEAGFLQRASFMNLLGVATGFESLRDDPRFRDLLRRMGLP